MSLINGHTFQVASVVLAVSASASFGAVLGNGGFEVAGINGSNDSALWNEGGGGGPGTVSERVVDAANANSGVAYHHLLAAGGTGIGGSAVIFQNSVADALMPPLVPGEVYTLSIFAKGELGPGGVAGFALRYLNEEGGILGNFNGSFAGVGNSYSEFTVTGDPAPVGAVAAFVEIVAQAGAFPESFSELYIDDVVVMGPDVVIPEPATLAGVATMGLLALRRRR